MLTQRQQLALVLAALPLAVGGSVVLTTALPFEVGQYLPAALTSIFIFALFWFLLYRQIGTNTFGELGFQYVGFIMAYTVIPTAAFVMAGLDAAGPLASLLPEPHRLRAHLWRHVLFQGCVAAGYLLFRGRESARPEVPERAPRDGRIIVVVAFALALSLASMILMSAPVTSYYDHYVRYDHLPWLQRKFVSLSLRLSLGLYCVLLVFLFRNYQKYKQVIPLVVLGIGAHEVTYSYGARIQALIVLLQAVCLYHYMVRRISMKAGLIGGFVIATMFSMVEVVRMLDDVSAARSIVAEEGLKPASEFGSVFYPGFHLYEERANGALPPVEWPMFFNDAISLVTFGDFTRWHPMSWYARNYYPDIDTPPFTIGPIAESAIWGGEWDLLFRGLVNGLFFAYIMRWFVRYKDKWWAQVIYVYCFATCILALKYSVFLHLSLIEKNLLPTLMLVQAVRALTFARPAVPAVERGVSL